MNFGGLKTKIDLNDLSKRTALFFSRKSKWILIAIFAVSVAFCLYLLYVNVYYPEWSESKKTEYLNSKEKNAEFSEEKFNKVIQKEQEKKKKFEQEIENIPNIFKLK